MKLPLVAIAVVFPLSACKPEPAAVAPAPPAAAADPAEPGSYMGLDAKTAGEMAEKAGFKWRIVEVDGESRPVTMDHRPDRLNFAVKDGKVIRVTQG